ncbi:MAG: hypothetical protein II399_09015 [Lachnospiraceae bacterium]|nr:hypothetical protein [Lachnospiraceae bacterium]
MAYETFITYGYGVIAPRDTKNITVEHLVDFCKQFKCTRDFIEDIGIDDIYEFSDDSMSLAGEYEGDTCSYAAFASMLRDAIYEKTGVGLEACSDDNGTDYLLFVQTYPWRCSEADKQIQTEEDVRNLIQPYLVSLYGEDNAPKFGYFECKNEG